MAVGTLNVTYSVVPEATVTFVAVVVPEGPPPEVVGLSVTVTLAGGIVPLGKPCPITVTLVTPVSAALGEVNPFSVTFVTAPNRSEPESTANPNTGHRTGQLAADTRLIRKLFIGGGRPGAHLTPVNFAETASTLGGKIGHEPLPDEVLSFLMYPGALPISKPTI